MPVGLTTVRLDLLCISWLITSYGANTLSGPLPYFTSCFIFRLPAIRALGVVISTLFQLRGA
jgi:hypothetical protein